MSFTLQELAALTGGELAGGGAQVITGAASLREAEPGEITFLGNRRFLVHFRMTRASAAFVPLEFNEPTEVALIRVAQPAKAFEQVVLKLAPSPVRFEPGVHPTAVIAADAVLGEGVSVQPFVVIEASVRIGANTVVGAHSYLGHGVSLGADCYLHPRVTIRERVTIGERVLIHSGVVIGSDGFGFELVEGVQRKVPQLGTVQIEDDVEIGANCAIDRARFGRTWIQRGVKLDNMVHVGHNVVIGAHTVVAAQTAFAGSSRTGEYVLIGGQVAITEHAEVGDRNMLGGQAGVTKNLPPNGGAWWSTPAIPLAEFKKQRFWIHRLGDLFDRVKALEKKLGL